MMEMKDKRIDDELLENVSGGKNLFGDRFFGKKNEDDKKMNVSGTYPGQRVTTPETIKRA